MTSGPAKSSWPSLSKSAQARFVIAPPELNIGKFRRNVSVNRPGVWRRTTSVFVGLVEDDACTSQRSREPSPSTSAQPAARFIVAWGRLVGASWKRPVPSFAYSRSPGNSPVIPLTRRSGSPSLSKSPTASTLAVTFCSRPKKAPTKPYRPSLRNQLAWLLIDPGRMSKSPSPSTSAQNARDPSKKRAGSGTSEKVGGLPPLLRSKRTEPPSSSKSRLPSPSKSAGTAPVILTPPGSLIPGTSTPDPRFVQISVGDTTRSNNPSPLKSPQAGWKSSAGGSCELTRANSGSTTLRMKLTRFVSRRVIDWTQQDIEFHCRRQTTGIPDHEECHGCSSSV